MRGWIQDCLRSIIGLGITGLGLALQIVHLFKIRTFFCNQRRLRQQYAIVSIHRYCRMETSSRSSLKMPPPKPSRRQGLL